MPQTAQPNSGTVNNSFASDPTSLYSSVQSHYGEAAKSADSDYGRAVASAFGYSKEELTNIPKESNLGLSCGNPFVIANLREGETVIDLGSGAGFDVFQAATKVGSQGKAIGVDMNDVIPFAVYEAFIRIAIVAQGSADPAFRKCSHEPEALRKRTTSIMPLL